MEVKDILGIGKVLPMDKLIDIVSNSLGKIFKPYFDRKDIDNKAYEIKKLAEARAEEMKIISLAIKENFQNTDGIEYKEEKLIINSPKNQQPLILASSIEERSQERSNFQEAKKQLNIESVTAFAAEELKNEQPVTDEPLDEDWTTRFFRIAEEISNEEMQALWGKILAGEIKQPKSYSLRTLELIRNLTSDEANLFIKVANFAINTGNTNFIFKGNNDELSKDFVIQYSDIAKLVEIGLVQSGDLVTWNLYKNENDMQHIFTSGNFIILLKKKSQSADISIPIYLFTNSGNELLKLISINPSFEYLTKFANLLKQDNAEVKYAHILSRTKTHINHTQPFQEFPTT